LPIISVFVFGKKKIFDFIFLSESLLFLPNIFRDDSDTSYG